MRTGPFPLITPRGRLLGLALVAGCSGTVTGGGTPDATIEPPLPDAAPPSEYVCANLHAEVEAVTPTVTLVVDRSGSMRRAYGGMSRWTALYRTLMDPETGVVARLDDQVRFGLMLYSGHDGDPAATCPILRSVDPLLDGYAALDAIYGPARPGEGTPTGAALRAAIPALAAVTEAGPRLFILATDGEPDTCEAPSSDSSPVARGEVLGAVDAAFEDGMATYVIGVGGDIAEEHLQAVANAGRGLTSGDAAVYRALDPDALVAAFDAIIRGARGCAFALDHPIEGLVVASKVTLDGEALVRGEDWKLRDDVTLELVGLACESVLAGGTHQVEARLTCDKAPVP